MPSNRRQKILIVEDDLQHLMVATIRAARGGYYEVLIAERGDEGVMLARSHAGQLALIVMDIRLPGMDGVEAIRRIRKFSPNVPILAISAYGDKYREAALAAGANEYLQKGVGLAEIFKRVEALMLDG